MSGVSGVPEPREQAVCAAVGPYVWRAFTAEMVARRLLGAVDRLAVLQLIGRAPTDPALEYAAVDPVDRDDERLEGLVHVMASFRWRDLTLTQLVRLLLESLDQWWSHREALERDLAQLLDEGH